MLIVHHEDSSNQALSQPRMNGVIEQLEAAKSPDAATCIIRELRKTQPGLLMDARVLRAYLWRLVETFQLSADTAIQNWCVVMSAELFPRRDSADVALQELGVEKSAIQQHVNAEYRQVLLSIERMRLANPELRDLLQRWNTVFI